MEELAKRNMVLEEMRRTFDKVWSDSDTLDTKLQNILTFLSISISIAASIEATAFKDAGIYFWVALLAAFALYVVAFIVIIVGLNPNRYRFPVSNRWEEIYERYFRPSELEVIDVFVADHLRVTDDLKKRNQPKIEAIRTSSYLMVAVIFFLMVAVPVGLAFPDPTLSCVFKQIFYGVVC